MCSEKRVDRRIELESTDAGLWEMLREVEDLGFTISEHYSNAAPLS